MRKKFRFLICVLLFSVLVLGITAACGGSSQTGGNTHTLTLMLYNGEPTIEITAKEGADISDQLPVLSDTDDYYFGGWCETNFISEPTTLPTKMPSRDMLFCAKWYRTYTVEKYLQKTDLSGYEETCAESITGEVIKDHSLPMDVEEFLEADPAGYTLHVGGEYDSTRTLTLDKKDNVHRMYYDFKQFELSYEANLPEGVAVKGEMASELILSGVEHTLAANGFLADGYRFAGWSLTPDGEKLIESVVPTGAVTVYAIWDEAHVDAFGGSDYIYIPRAEEGVAYLDRVQLGEKKGTYNAATSVFTFTHEEGTLSGKVIGEWFFYFQDVWQTVLTNENGATLELKADGSAVLVEGGHTVNGSYSIDLSTGYFILESNDTERLFVLLYEDDELTFSFSGSEQGWYALETEDGFGYDLLFLDGFGRMSVYAVSPNSPVFDAYFDVYYGSYELAEDDEEIYVATYLFGLYSSTFPFKLTPVEDKELDGVKLKGTYIFGDYRGTFTDLDYEYNTIYLDGFGHGTFGYYHTKGTYTIEEDSWLVDNYPTPGIYTESIVVFTDESGDEYRFAIFDEYYLEVSSFHGRYEFEVIPESIYAGTTGDVAFMYFSGYTIYVDGSFNDGYVWFGNYEPKYSVSGYTGADLPLYDWRDDGGIYRTDKENVYRYESAWGENVAFEFELTEDRKIRWHIAEDDVVFYNEGGEKIYVDTFGVGRYEHNGTTREVPFGYNLFLKSDSLRVETEEDFEYLVLYSFLINGEYRSFAYTAPLTYVGMGGELTNLKEVEFVAFIGNIGMLIAYKDGTATAGLDMSLFGGVGYWFAITGGLTHSDGAADAWNFKAYGEAPEGDDEAESEEYRIIFERFSNLDFKLGAPHDGIYDCLEKDGIVYNITCANGTLVTDGYGTAIFTPKGGKTYACSYSMQDGALYLLYETEDDYMDWFLIIDEDGASFTYAGDEAGTYFTYDDYGSLDTNNLIILNGSGLASGYYEGYWLEGEYTATGIRLSIGAVSFLEYVIEVTYYEGPAELTELYALMGLASSEIHIGYLFFRDDSALGEFMIVDEDGKMVGYLTGDGYTGAVYERGEDVFYGEMHIGDSADSPRTNDAGERDFLVNIAGSSILFFGEYGEEFLFDIVKEGEALLRTLEYGVYASYTEGSAGNGLLKLDGHGGAVLKDGDGHETRAYYELFDDASNYRLFDEKGETIFIFNLAHMNNEENDDDYYYGYLYVYRLFSEKMNGLYINKDWTVLYLNGFGDALYVDKYGFTTYYEAIPVDETTVFLRGYNGENKFVEFKGEGFEFISREFIVSEEGTLLAYNGKGGSISLPDEVLRIAEGVFDGVEITHVDFNKVEIIDAYVFAGQDLDGVYAPNLRIIGERAFAGNSGYNFEEVYIPNVTEIGEAAFISCTWLELVTLGAIKSIGEQAFAGSGYGSLIIDMTEVDAAQVAIASNAFLALNADALRIVMKNIAAVNAAIENNSWPTKAIESMILWYDPDAYGADHYLFSMTDGAMFELENGIVSKATADKNGETVLTAVALYEEHDGLLSVYTKQGNKFVTTPVTAYTSTPFAITIGDSVAFSDSGWDGLHTLTLTDGKLQFEVSVTGSSYYTAYLSRYTVKVSNVTVTQDGETVNGGDVTFDITKGVLEFSLEEEGVLERYAVRVATSTVCTLEKIGLQKTLTTEDEAFRIIFLVDEDGNPVQLVSLENKPYYSYETVTVHSCKVEGNTLTVEYESAYNMRDVVKFTYHASSDTVTTQLVSHIYIATNVYQYEEGIYVAATIVFGEDLKITEVRSFGIGQSYGSGEPQEIADVSYNADGSATVTLSNGDKYKITVEYVYNYSVTISKAK